MLVDPKKAIRMHEGQLSKSERFLANYLLEHQQATASCSIQDLSTATTLSTATISRFAKKIGYPSFQALKLALNKYAQEEQIDIFADIPEVDGPYSLAKKTFHSHQQALVDTENLLIKEDFLAALEILNRSQHLSFFGLGASQVVVLDGYHKFVRTALPCDYQNDYHLQLMAASKLTENDCALLISYTGENQEMLRIAEVLASHNVPMICITRSSSVPLAKIATQTLTAYAAEVQQKTEVMSVLLAQMALVDALFLAYSHLHDAESKDIRFRIRETINQTRNYAN